MNSLARPTALIVLALALTACGGGSSSGGPANAVNDAAVAPGDQPKEVTFTWTDDGDEPVDAFRLEVNPDGVSGFTGADVDGDGSVDDDDLIAGDASEVSVALPVHRTDFDNARYQVVGLDSDGNELDRSASVGLLNNVTAEDIIGYFSAPGDRQEVGGASPLQ